MNGPSVRIIDANIIIRFLLRDDPILSKRAKSLFTDAEDGKFFVISMKLLLQKLYGC